MKIAPNNNPVELSYLDLLGGLERDVKSDQTMPKEVKRKIIDQLGRMAVVLTPYSH